MLFNNVFDTMVANGYIEKARGLYRISVEGKAILREAYADFRDLTANINSAITYLSN